MSSELFPYVFPWYIFSILFLWTLNVLKTEIGEFSLIGTIFLLFIILIVPSVYYGITLINKNNEQKKQIFNRRVFIIGICHSTNLCLLLISVMLIGASFPDIWKTFEVIGVSFISSIVMKLERYNTSIIAAIAMNFIGMWLSIWSNNKDNHSYIAHLCGILAVIMTAIRNVNIIKYNNIYNRKLYVWEFTIVSMLFFVFPIFIILLIIDWMLNEFEFKYISNDLTHLITHHYGKLIILSITHFLYNICSISVLNICKPTYHALLSSVKRVIAIMSIYALNVWNIIGLIFISLAIIIAKTKKIQKYISLSTTNSIAVISIIVIAFMSVFMMHFIVSNPVIPSYEISANSVKFGVSNISLLVSSCYYLKSNQIEYIHTLSQSNVGYNVIIYYNNDTYTTCYDKMETNSRSNIVLNRLNLKVLSTNTPLQSFIRNHRYNRLKRGKYFADDMDKISALLILFKHGGTHINMDVNGNENYIINEANHQLLHDVMSRINREYISYDLSIDDWPLILNTNQVFGDLFEQHAQEPQKSDVATQHYGILSYDHRAGKRGPKYDSQANAGDETQTFSGLQFIPFIDRFIDRDNWRIDDGKYKVNTYFNNKKEEITVFLNAWYGAKNMIWPPFTRNRYITMNPLLLSMHFSAAFKTKINSLESKSYFNNYDYGVGARDSRTWKLLKDNNIKSYFSGCATLLLQNPFHENDNIVFNQILIIDVRDEAMGLLQQVIPQNMKKNIKYLTQSLPDYKDRGKRMSRYHYSNIILQEIAKSKLVITSRIHCAIPSVAMNVSVIFIKSQSLPGGHSVRIAGLTDLFHTHKPNDILNALDASSFNWMNPPLNPSYQKFIRFRATQWHIIRKYNALYQNAITFGVVPFKVHHNNNNNNNICDFIQIYTTNAMSLLYQRSIESIFYHNPLSKLCVFSNELQPDDVSEFMELGFDIKIINYSLSQLLYDLSEQSPVYADIINIFITDKLSMFNNEMGLLRLLILYLYGGTYFDTDIILINKMDKMQNVLGYTYDSDDLNVNDAVMKFAKHNTFIINCIVQYLTTKQENTPQLLTQVAKKYNISHLCDYLHHDIDEIKRKKCTLTLFKPEAFDRTYVMRIEDNVKTQRPDILNDFCLFCSEEM